jgi:coenzyme F420-0:L-glutamate ligase/coenzyme F420-1:gamma-L-glutamate ligase
VINALSLLASLSGKEFNREEYYAETEVCGGNWLKSFTAMALEHFPLVKIGDDIGEMIVGAAVKNGLRLEDGDVIVIAQKVFSKAEGKVVKLSRIVPSRKAQELAQVIGKSAEFVELVLRETKRVLKASNDILLVEDKRGMICINAGIDKSNVRGRDNFALLPENPDESAEKCRLRIKELTSKNVGVVICDTYSRPFRRAQVNFAIGFAGVGPFRDYRGKKDLFGQILRVKNIAVVDELAASAELLMGQGKEARPVVVFRGLANALAEDEKDGTKELYMSGEEDLFKSAL